jgi:hypothetical protein
MRAARNADREEGQRDDAWHSDGKEGFMRRLTIQSGIALGLFCLSIAARAELTPDIASAIEAALERNHVLTKAQAHCVVYVPEQETAAYVEAGVHELHGQGCPGDPDTGPRMFSVRYDKRSHAVFKENDARNGYDRLR